MREVSKLEAEIFQQQEEEGGDWQPQAGGDVRGEQHKLPGAQVAEGSRACSDPPTSLLSAPPQQAAHCVQLFFSLETTGMSKGCHLTMEVKQSTRGSKGRGSSKAKGRKGWKEEGECGKVTAVCGSSLYEA